MPSAGWFSERSGAYLASGRPVLMEETGISQHIPTGEGLLIFSSIDEAAARVHEVMDRPEAHMRGARTVAERFLDSRTVLPQMIQASA